MSITHRNNLKRIFCAAIYCAVVGNVAVAETMTHGDHMMAPGNFSKLMLDKFEVGDNLQRWDAQAWYGSDLNKIWLKTEGERSDGSTEHAELHAYYSRAITPFFDLQLGARHDFQPQPGRDWLAIGLQGLAPYFFETETTLFIGDNGRSNLRLKASYDLLFTQRLILAPEIEANLYGKDDPTIGIGSGFSDIEFGLRLRYELRREFAPYLGVAWTHQYGDTATLTRMAGGDAQDVQWVVGVKAWF